ncbi:hypothetical protein [Paenibacillus radicis (ex Gao et al. 2016)]|uniref:Uncharacterized protein n=1 Tax=Paenibacillus radicis (ex Gao et al. 2016) TaxID=1737354 RepID=A0A917GWV0_9BACL|nr:hypothetical protein [Paenibacillus radicis (ex Gao et al. 2016)]GGG59977.1 hypothetical protein GCM10010918_11480 [Paenibacillus radicis (ex Gao et al. 2016)]
MKLTWKRTALACALVVCLALSAGCAKGSSNSSNGGGIPTFTDIDKVNTGDEQVVGNPFEAAGVSDPIAFGKMFRDVRVSVMIHHKEKLADLILYPLMVHDGKETRTIEDKAQFLEEYDTIITADVEKVLKDQRVNALMATEEGVMAGSGEVWFRATKDNPQKYGVFAILTTKMK